MIPPDEWTPEVEEEWESNIDWDALSAWEQELLLAQARGEDDGTS